MKITSKLFIVISLVFIFPAFSESYTRKCKVELEKVLSPIIADCQLIILPKGKIDTNGSCSQKIINETSTILRDFVTFFRKNEMPLSGNLFLKDTSNGVTGTLQSNVLKQKQSFDIPFLKNIGTMNSFKTQEKILDNGVVLQLTGKEYVILKLTGGFGVFFIEGYCEL